MYLGLPNCKMLHKNLMVAWESFPPQLTIQVRKLSPKLRIVCSINLCFSLFFNYEGNEFSVK